MAVVWKYAINMQHRKNPTDFPNIADLYLKVIDMYTLVDS